MAAALLLVSLFRNPGVGSGCFKHSGCNARRQHRRSSDFAVGTVNCEHFGRSFSSWSQENQFLWTAVQLYGLFDVIVP